MRLEREGEGKQGDGRSIGGPWCEVQQSGVEEEQELTERGDNM